MSLCQLLSHRQLLAQETRALRLTLNAQDKSSELDSLATLLRTGHAAAYARMQDGKRLGQVARVLIFAAEPQGRARLIDYRQFFARRQGNAPGDIVYDPDLAHLLHNFILRARRPVFYDTHELDGMSDLCGHLVVQWPTPLASCIRKLGNVDMAILAQ